MPLKPEPEETLALIEIEEQVVAPAECVATPLGYARRELRRAIGRAETGDRRRLLALAHGLLEVECEVRERAQVEVAQRWRRWREDQAKAKAAR